MFLTTHAAAGLLLSQYIHQPLALFGASFASHFVLDFIPHGDQHLYGNYEIPEADHRWRRAVVINFLDVAALMILSLWVIGGRSDTAPTKNLMLIGILGSVLPDFISNFFPVIHEKLSWLALVRWLHALSKTVGLPYFVRGQNWLHRVLHH